MIKQVLFLEEKQCYTAGDSAVAVVDKYLKQEEYALEEVHHKGTLLERVALLENRVNQVSQDPNNILDLLQCFVK